MTIRRDAVFSKAQPLEHGLIITHVYAAFAKAKLCALHTPAILPYFVAVHVFVQRTFSELLK